jgi:hypothetical protein
MSRKQPRKDKGQGDIWDEPKSENLGVRLTLTGKERAEEQAKALGISRNELFERYARGLIELAEISQEELLSLLEQTGYRLSAKVILRSLASLTEDEIAQIGTTCFELLLNRSRNPPAVPEPPQPRVIETFQDLLMSELAHRQQKASIDNLPILAQDEQVIVTVELLEAIARGRRPSNSELVLLEPIITQSKSDGTPWTLEDLEDLRKRQFGNGNNQPTNGDPVRA